ncbi:MAG TPA: hypothetical protein VNG12_09135 [Acidimicrobiales bacterium]|nr:hypothetical protein [Acidimicrobiales bacterium]
MWHVDDGQLGEVGDQLVQLTQSPRRQRFIDTVTELFGRQPAIGEMPLKGGYETVSFAV